MNITEPTTTLTDYLIAVVASILAVFLLRLGWANRQISVGLWAVAFGCVAAAAALGGTCHGFVGWLGESLSDWLWQTMIYALSLASFTMLAGTIVGSVSPKRQRWLLLGTAVKSILVWIGLVQKPEFEIAAVDYLVSMAVVLVLQLYQLSASPLLPSSSTQAAPWLIAGVLVSGLAIGFLGSGFTLSAFFNHNDLYHLVQLVGLGLLYQGAKQLKDQ